MKIDRKKTVAISTVGLFTMLKASILTFASDSGVYDHLMSDTFYYRSGNTKWGERFELWSKTFLEIILPFMAIFGISNIVLSMSASVIYLSRPDFFDKVHILKYMKRNMKGGDAKGVMKTFQKMKELGLKNSVMTYFIPDFKALAFYDAAEIGEDGRPSVTTFLKSGFPKYAAILALIIMISDGTLMNINLKAAEVSRWFFVKAESYDYIGTLDKFSQQGAKYKVPYTGGKKKIFNTVYETALSLDDSITATSQGYREQVGSKVDSWVNQNFTDSDFEGTRVAAKARATTVSLGTQGTQNQGDKRIFEIPIETFGVTPTRDQRYIVLEVEFATVENLMARPTYSTANPEAWEGNGTSVVLDVTKLPNIKTIDASNIEIIPNSVTVNVNSPVNASATVNINSTRIEFTISDPNYKAIEGEFKYRVKGQSQVLKQTYRFASQTEAQNQTP